MYMNQYQLCMLHIQVHDANTNSETFCVGWKLRLVQVYKHTKRTGHMGALCGVHGSCHTHFCTFGCRQRAAEVTFITHACVEDDVMAPRVTPCMPR